MPVVVVTRGDTKYVDVIVQRWQQSTGGEARHAETGRPFSASGQIAQSADRKISRKRAADRNHADASYATGIERSVGSVRHKVLKATLDSSPLRIGAEGVPVGLPRPGEVLGAQMNAVFLAVTEDVELDPLPSAGVDALTIGCEIDRNLHEATVVFQADVAPHANSRSARHCLSHHRSVGDATHHTVGEQLPIAESGGSRLRSSMMADFACTKLRRGDNSSRNLGIAIFAAGCF